MIGAIFDIANNANIDANIANIGDNTNINANIDANIANIANNNTNNANIGVIIAGSHLPLLSIY